MKVLVEVRELDEEGVVVEVEVEGAQMVRYQGKTIDSFLLVGKRWYFNA